MIIKENILKFLASIVRMFRGEVSTEKLIKKGMKVGVNFSRQGGCRIDASFPFLIEFGDNVGLSTDVTILTHDNSLKRHIGVLKVGKVKVGNNVFIGAKSTILPNVIIGDNVIIGAGSVVTHNIPSNVVCAGNPARVISSLEHYIEKNKQNISKSLLLGREYTPLSLDETKKNDIINIANSGFAYIKSHNYDKLRNK